MSTERTPRNAMANTHVIKLLPREHDTPQHHPSDPLRLGPGSVLQLRLAPSVLKRILEEPRGSVLLSLGQEDVWQAHSLPAHLRV